MFLLQLNSQMAIEFVTEESIGAYTCESGNGIDDMQNYTINVFGKCS